MQPLDFLLISLAAFYVSFAVSSTHGPFHVFAMLRGRVPMSACLVCLAPWCAALFYGLWLVVPPVVYVFAAGGTAVFVWRWTGADHV